MLIESWVRFCSPHIISGASHQTSFLQNNWRKQELVLKCKKKNRKWFLLLIRCNSSLQKPRDLKSIWKDIIVISICSPDIIVVQNLTQLPTSMGDEW